MKLCSYDCGQEGKFLFKNGKWCCSKYFSSCPEMRKKNNYSSKGKSLSQETIRKMNEAKKGKNNPMYGRTHSKETIIKITKSKKGKGGWIKGKSHSRKSREKMSKTRTEMYINGWEAKSCGKAKKYKYISPVAGEVCVDGKWELGVAKYLDKIKVIWKRNKKRFPYINLRGKLSTYCPDFYVYDWSCYIEVKGYKIDLDRCKWSQFSDCLQIWTSDILIENKIIDKNGELTESG